MRVEWGHCLWGRQQGGGVGDWTVTVGSAHGHTQPHTLTRQLGPRCKPPSHLEGIRAPANKVRWPFSGWSLLSLRQEV